MRTFFAVDMDEETNEKVNELMKGLAIIDRTVAWVRPSNHHITLYFFGEVDQETLTGIESVAGSVCKTVKPFSLTVQGISAFPAINRPRVIWIGVENPSGELHTMHDEIAKRVRTDVLAVHMEDRDYTPHLTIGRVKNRCSTELIQEVKSKSAVRFGTFQVRRAVLYQSILKREGPLYTPLRVYDLR